MSFFPSIHTARVRAGMLLICGLSLSACAGLSSKDNFAAAKPGTLQTEGKFTSKEYGVAVSDRVVESIYQPIPRGGGREQIGKPYKIRGKWYKPKHQPNYDKTGIASWYGPNFHGRKTANGEIYDQTGLSAAHPTLPLPSYVRVTNLKNKRSVIVRVNDRGPFVGNRIIDLSYRTAELLGTRSGGLAKVRVQYVGKARLDGLDEEYLLASYQGPGSVKPSEIAAKERLLAHAGLSPEEISRERQRLQEALALASVDTSQAEEKPAKPSVGQDAGNQIVVRNKLRPKDNTVVEPLEPLALVATSLFNSQ